MAATKAQVRARAEEVLRIRLDGAQFWDVREYVRENEPKAGSSWFLADGAKPLSDGQLWRYIAKADALIAESCRASRKKLIRRHLAQRRNLYAKAVTSNDLRTALACVQDEAALLDLYPAKRAELTGKGNATLVVQIVEEVIGRGDASPPALPQGPADGDAAGVRPE